MQAFFVISYNFTDILRGYYGDITGILRGYYGDITGILRIFSSKKGHFMVKKVLITGKNGQVVSALRTLSNPNFELICVSRPELDLQNLDNFDTIITAIKPDFIINAAAYTFVDKAEDEPELAFKINGLSAGIIAKSAAKIGVPIIHISTDYVFDGQKPTTYNERDRVNPMNVYGASKLLGETKVQNNNLNHIILRTSWVYSPFGSNFVKTMLKYGAEREVLKVVNDQFGNPTSAFEIANAMFAILEQLSSGNLSSLGETFHFSGNTDTSWCGFAQEIFKQSQQLGGPNPIIEPISSDAFPTKVKRPKNSRLDCTKFEKQFNFQRDSLDTSLGKIIKTLNQ
jgi:dTDP-4-dehydrorhamnose reductase